MDAYFEVLAAGWRHMQRFWEWRCVDHIIPLEEVDAVHRGLLLFTNGIVFLAGVTMISFILTAYFLVMVPVTAISLSIQVLTGVRLLDAEGAFACLAIPDYETQGNGWLVVLPVVGGLIGVAWLAITVVWAPLVFVALCFASPMLLPMVLCALCMRRLRLKALFNAIRILFIWPAYFAYVLVFTDFELEPAAPTPELG
mmetsp:Transcript_1738/g.5123  ORF Transcript_1738/g.5123 Transcript_1738/m.5123 type:complete len:198 (-) Transcript_1738:143-736(-)